MYPTLFKIPIGGGEHFYVSTYFTMVGIGFVIGYWLLRRWAIRHEVDRSIMLDFVIWMVIWGIVGARILHVIADGHFWDYVNACRDPSKIDWLIDKRECLGKGGAWDKASSVCHPVETNCWAWANILNGGFAFYGGFIAAALFSIHFVRRWKLPAGKLVDIGGWTLMLGLAWGRMGCFLAGCCFGARTDGLLGIIFPAGSPASRHHWHEGWLNTYRHDSFAVHPTQLYESIAGFLVAAIAYFVVRPRKRFDGQVFCFSVVGYAVARFLLEIIRRDERGGMLGFTTSQLVAVILVGVSIWFWFMFRRRASSIMSPGGSPVTSSKLKDRVG